MILFRTHSIISKLVVFLASNFEILNKNSNSLSFPSNYIRYFGLSTTLYFAFSVGFIIINLSSSKGPKSSLKPKTFILSSSLLSDLLLSLSLNLSNSLTLSPSYDPTFSFFVSLKKVLWLPEASWRLLV